MTAQTNSNDSAPKTQRWAVWAGQAQAGDRRAYNRLLSEIAPFIRNSLAGKLANPDWAEDITQEVLISVHKSLKTYAPDRPFIPWLMAIVSFRKTDFLRKYYSARGHQQASDEDINFMRQHVTNPAHAGEYKDIEAALGSLSPQQRKVFEMIKIQGFTAKEVAEKTGMSVSAVKVSVHRSLGKIKKKLETG